MLGGSNSPALRSFSHSARTAFVASGVRVVIRSSVNRCRVNGGGSVGSTCDGESFLPFNRGRRGLDWLHWKERLPCFPIEDI